MTDGSGEKLTHIIFGVCKLFIALFVLKVVCMVLGFPGYIPLADETYAFMIKMLAILGTGRGIMPTNF